MEKQNEFLFSEGPTSEFFPPDPCGGFYREVATIWQLPVGERVRVLLRDHDVAEIAGRLELEHAPNLPLNARESLGLMAGGVSFRSTQILSWSIAG
ncbi:MAG TPA: hypothetical protein VGM64_02105 [Lacunisphaera sp.]|jgi:hypothetical protein